MKRSAQSLLILAVFITAGPLRPGHAEDSSQRTRQFVVMGYQGLQMELTSGAGPYVRTLLDLLSIPVGAEMKTTTQLKTLLTTYPNIMDFADQVVLLQSAVATAQAKAEVAGPVPVPSGESIYSGEKLVLALEHLTRGMEITVYLKTGEQLKGTFTEYASKRLWLRGATRRWVALDDILAVEAKRL